MLVPFRALDRQYRDLRKNLVAVFDRIGSSAGYIMGQGLEEFEARIAEYCETQYAVGVANGSDSMFLAMKALGIGPGDEVITCPNSFIATAWTIVAAGATPVFVDATDEYTIDTNGVAKAITPRTKAIIPVHLTGRPAAMDELKAIVAGTGIHLIEDAAQAIGARYKGARVGSLGICGSFSLHPLKSLNAMGDGGVITTNSKELWDKIKLLRNHGLKNRDECDVWGYNSRLDALQAAIVMEKMPFLDGWIERCRKIASFYRDELEGLVWVPRDKPHEFGIYHNFIIRTDQRDVLMDYLLQQGIETKVHYPIPIHLQKCAKDLGYSVGDFPVVETHARTIMSLPLYPELTDEEAALVTSKIKRFFAEKTGSKKVSADLSV